MPGTRERERATALLLAQWKCYPVLKLQIFKGKSDVIKWMWTVVDCIS